MIGSDTERHSRTDNQRRNGGTDLSLFGRLAYVLFARHADDDRRDRDRRRYRATHWRTSFDVLVARGYAASWAVGVTLALVAFPVATRAFETPVAVGCAFTVGVGGKWATVRGIGVFLSVRATARRARIRQTLPGAARYLHALSSGADDARTMLRRVAETEAYGETARAIRVALHTARLTGSLRRGLERVARDTPADETLAPFLLKFREHAQQGDDALADYLRLESRMLDHRQERTRDRNADVMELIGESFVVLLVLPALLVVVVTVMSVLAPGLARPIRTPIGTLTGRTLVTVGSAGFVLCTGAICALAVQTLRPTRRRDGYERPGGLETLTTAGRNPASASVVCLPVAVVTLVAAFVGPVDPLDAVLAGYVAFAVPVGGVAWRRHRLDDAKDRQLTDFVHAVSGHVGLGRPPARAVSLVARDVDLGPLDPDVADLAFNLRTRPTDETDTRTAALERFVDRVGTPFAAQTVGLLIGTLNAGSDAESVFETLRTEASRLHHRRRTLRSNMLVYVAVGWTTALLVVGIVLAVDTQVVDSFSQLSHLSNAGGLGFDTAVVDPARAHDRFYLVTQATVIASGWFAGVADRDWYTALLHSGVLVAITAGVFAGVGT